MIETPVHSSFKGLSAGEYPCKIKFVTGRAVIWDLEKAVCTAPTPNGIPYQDLLIALHPGSVNVQKGASSKGADTAKFTRMALDVNPYKKCRVKAGRTVNYVCTFKSVTHTS